MNELVRLRTRPSRDGKTFVYMLDYVDAEGKRRRVSLGHADKRKAESQQKQTERELRMGVIAPASMRLSEFVEDSLIRTGDQIRASTKVETRKAMTDFIKAIGDIDYQKVTIREGERYRQALLDKGNSAATVIKKLKCVKHIFQLAVDRGQLEYNLLKRVKAPKAPKKKIEVYTPDECSRMIRVAGESKCSLRWDMLIALAVETGMRKNELLNLTWRDINFENICVDVSPKQDTEETWEWNIKDVDRRTVPVTEQMLALLVDYQMKRPGGYPYVFVPAKRYGYIQNLREQGKPAPTGRNKLITNFSRTFGQILKKAGLRHREFHDLRSTAITNWLYNGLKEHEVMRLAGHSSFETTHRFYLAVQPDLYERARQANAASMGESLARIWRAPSDSRKIGVDA
jgi:integrase